MIQNLIGRFEMLAAAVQSASEAFIFDRKNPQQVYSLCLLGTLLEHARGVTVLLKAQDATGPPVLLRSMLEAYIDLQNLVEDPSYIYSMEASWLDYRRRLGIAAIERGEENPYLDEFLTQDALSRSQSDIKGRLKELGEQGYSPLQIRKRFEIARRQDIYDSVYRLLCSQSHNNINALEDRHIERYPGGYRAVYFRPVTEEEVLKYIDTMAGVVANAVASVASLLEAALESLDLVKTNLEALRNLYPDTAD